MNDRDAIVADAAGVLMREHYFPKPTFGLVKWLDLPEWNEAERTSVWQKWKDWESIVRDCVR